ncbi:hypothetical protein [Sagittula sp. SSi028]|uniref:hypothetical protein n=1 Tax=Sagittula sp. SSi028 TaxID=3400636 RepID=UPI003AF6FCE5
MALITHSELNNGVLRALVRAIEAHRPRKFARDLVNRVRFGADGPLSDMAIFPDPREITQCYQTLPGLRLRRRASGRVMGGDWDKSRASATDNYKFQSCRMRWVDGADWEETPVFQKMVAEIAKGRAPDECRSVEDVKSRYAKLDRIFAETQARGRLLRMHELPDAYYRREHGASFVHVARDGTCLRSGGGYHRFSIAKILELPEMPAQIGVVHPDAIKNGHLAPLLKSRFDA